MEAAAEFNVEDTFVAKRKHTARPEWSRAIRGLMASSRHLRTQTALARKSGVTQSTIGRILRGEVDPQSDNLERLAHSFGMSYSTLAAIAEGGEPGNGEVETLQPGKIPRRVPLLSLVQARRFAESEYLDSLADATDWIEFPKKRHGPRTIALRVTGESMEPDYHNGDVIYIDPDVAPVHGKDVIVRLGERHEVTFKRLVVEGERRYLKPLNQNWPDKFINMPTDARIVGVVVGRYTDL
jgi:SOS-response transcriptional repressor LexA